MNKERVGVDKFLKCRRNEIINKFYINDEIKEQVTREELMSIIDEIENEQEVIKNRKPVEKKIKKATLEEKRSEIFGKFTGEQIGAVNVAKENEEKKVLKNNDSVVDFVNKYFDYMRSEILNKFEIDGMIKEKVNDEELELIISKLEEKQVEISKKEPIKKMVKEASLEEKRSEIFGKFSDGLDIKRDFKEVNNEIKSMDNSSEDLTDEEKLENKEDKVQENVENISIAMIVLVVAVCLVVGAIIGYMLYSIAMNNS